MTAPAVSVSNIFKSFKAGQPVVKDVSLTVAEGEMIGLIGASGSGKSTLIRLIAGFETIDKGQGEIRLFGKQCQHLGQRKKAITDQHKNVGIIFQQFNLVGRLTLLLNVLVGRLGRVSGWKGTFGFFPKEDRIIALRALERVGIVDMAYQRASTLSGGQQQRAAIARMLAQEAKLILADEPIASLDPASADNVMSTLREINKQDGVTVIVSLHQIDHAFKHCDRIIALKDGHVVHDGDVGDITREHLTELYGIDAFEGDEFGAPDDEDGNDSVVTPLHGQVRDQKPAPLAAASAMDA